MNNKISAFNVGDKVIAFDGHEWMKKGDIGNNDCFRKEATVVRVRQRKSNNEWLADVVFNDGSESNGHFQSTLKRNLKP
jgi:hypothetical protein